MLWSRVLGLDSGKPGILPYTYFQPASSYLLTFPLIHKANFASVATYGSTWAQILSCSHFHVHSKVDMEQQTGVTTIVMFFHLPIFKFRIKKPLAHVQNANRKLPVGLMMRM